MRVILQFIISKWTQPAGQAKLSIESDSRKIDSAVFVRSHASNSQLKTYL